jgi:hemolysin activation/secretion protein
MRAYIFVVVCVFLMGYSVCFGSDANQPSSTSKPDKLQEKLRKKAEDAEKLKEKREAAEKTKHEKATKKAEAEDIKWLERLPEDTTPKIPVKEFQIKGNSLISTEKLLKDLPSIYNSSQLPIKQAPPDNIYDFRTIRDIIQKPGEIRYVSARTVQGFTQYLLSVYQAHNYSGVYVYIPAESISASMQSQGGILPVEVIEAKISEVNITHYDPNGKKTEKEYLRNSIMRKWSQAKPGKVANKKKMDDVINLLNQNPDRYISATVSKGTEPNSLVVGYDIFEVSPWHYFIQLDNAGTKERRWAPRVGVINTGLTGRDDKFTVIAQGKPESGIEDNYSIYGSYEFPLWTPRLRLNLFGAYSKFDVSGGGIDFLGNGYSYGGILRFNAFQKDDWFFDLLASLKHEKSKVTPSLFPEFFGADVSMDLWGIGFEIHRSSDMANTSLGLDYSQSMNGSSNDEFNKARTGAERDFSILTFSASHSQFLDSTKIHRLLGSFKYIRPDERLVPAQMTAFGGMYTVRGYEDSEIVADGGILASAQYEYDLVKREQAGKKAATGSDKAQNKKPLLRKLAPLAFFDYGRAQIKDAVAGEKSVQNLYSIGPGILVELGDNFNAGLFYGYPLKATDATDTGEGRFNINMMLRW